MKRPYQLFLILTYFTLISAVCDTIIDQDTFDVIGNGESNYERYQNHYNGACNVRQFHTASCQNISKIQLQIDSTIDQSLQNLLQSELSYEISYVNTLKTSYCLLSDIMSKIYSSYKVQYLADNYENILPYLTEDCETFNATEILDDLPSLISLYQQRESIESEIYQIYGQIQSQLNTLHEVVTANQAECMYGVYLMRIKNIETWQAEILQSQAYQDQLIQALGIALQNIDQFTSCNQDQDPIPQECEVPSDGTNDPNEPNAPTEPNGTIDEVKEGPDEPCEPVDPPPPSQPQTPNFDGQQTGTIQFDDNPDLNQLLIPNQRGPYRGHFDHDEYYQSSYPYSDYDTSTTSYYGDHFDTGPLMPSHHSDKYIEHLEPSSLWSSSGSGDNSYYSSYSDDNDHKHDDDDEYDLSNWGNDHLSKSDSNLIRLNTKHVDFDLIRDFENTDNASWCLENEIQGGTIKIKNHKHKESSQIYFVKFSRVFPKTPQIGASILDLKGKDHDVAIDISVLDVITTGFFLKIRINNHVNELKLYYIALIPEATSIFFYEDKIKVGGINPLNTRTDYRSKIISEIPKCSLENPQAISFLTGFEFSAANGEYSLKVEPEEDENHNILVKVELKGNVRLIKVRVMTIIFDENAQIGDEFKEFLSGKTKVSFVGELETEWEREDDKIVVHDSY